MSEKKLAHIEQIDWIRPIEGADRIVTYGILGWEVVDQKDKYNIGDKIIYCEVDSVLPEKPEYEFLRDRKFRIRTIKLKGQVSMGLILPFPDKWFTHTPKEIGLNLTELLGITKYLSPSEREETKKIEVNQNKLTKFMKRYSWYRRLFLSRKQKEGFPYWVSKTDEERIQNIPKVLQDFADKEVYVTEKIDYQSGTWSSKQFPKFNNWIGRLLPLKETRFVVCSRNQQTNDKNDLYWKIARKYNLEKICKENPGITIQGEQGSTNVQGNKYSIIEPTMWVFNIIDHEKNYHFNYGDMQDFCMLYGLNIVPRLHKEFAIKLESLGSTVQELVEFSKGKSIINPSVEREGIVVRCIENGKKILSFKVINPNFLLKYSDE